MPRKHPAPDDPRTWLARARSDWKLATAAIPGVLLEDLCYHAQQCAEKALKARLLAMGREFPRTHDLALLVSRLEAAGEVVPKGVQAAVGLTEYAVEGRYPGFSEAVTERQRRRAAALAGRVLLWVETRLRR